MTLKNWILASLGLVFPALAGAQGYDPQYLEVIPSSFTLRPYYAVEAGYWAVKGDNRDSDIYYKSAELHKVGLSIAKWGLAVGYGVALKNGAGSKDEKIYGHSDSYTFFTHYYGRKYGIDFSYAHNKGFYISNPGDLGISSPDGVMPQYPDMESRFISLSVIRVFNYREFSLNAPFDQGERQKLGAGSWLLQTIVYYGQLQSPTPIIPAQIDSNYNELKGLTETSLAGFSISPGGAYTWVPLRNCYVSGALSVGLGAQSQVLHTAAGRNAHLRLAGNMQARVAVGWTGKKVFAGIYAIADIYSAPGSSAGQDSLLSQNQLFVGFNF